MEVLVRDIIKKAEEKLKEAGVVDFAVDSWLLAEFVFKINRTGFYMDPMMTVSKERADKYMELVGIRASKIPLQHITGSRDLILRLTKMCLYQGRIRNYLWRMLLHILSRLKAMLMFLICVPVQDA